MARTASVTDTRLMRRSQQGDRRAFRALLARYDWRLRGLAHALLLDAHRVDAVLRLAYVKAWREVVRIDPRDEAAAWLYRVVYNACIDGLRRESSRIGAAPPSAVDAPDVADDAPPEPAAPAAGNGASPAPTSGRRTRLVKALSALAPADRVAVVLVDREGFAPEAAARILGLTPEVVETRLAGARARLTHQLAAADAVPRAADETAAPAADDTAPVAETTVPAGHDMAPVAETAVRAADDAVPPAGDDMAPVAETAILAADDAGPPAGNDEGPPGDVDTAPAAETAVLAADDTDAPADDTAPAADAVAAPDGENEPQSEETPIRLDDIPAADPVDAKVASPGGGGQSPNGARGNGDTDGSGDGRAGEQ